VRPGCIIQNLLLLSNIFSTALTDSFSCSQLFFLYPPEIDLPKIRPLLLRCLNDLQLFIQIPTFVYILEQGECWDTWLDWDLYHHHLSHLPILANNEPELSTFPVTVARNTFENSFTQRLRIELVRRVVAVDKVSDLLIRHA
jgi:hypothetical protein